MKKASFFIYFDSEEDAKIIFESLEPEIKNKIPKTDTHIKVTKNLFKFEIISKDTSSLRAACNSYLRWISTIIKVKKII